jgi:hypothetical protein
MFNIRVALNVVFITIVPSRITRCDADDRGIRPCAVPTHRKQRHLGLLRGDESDDNSLVGEVKWLKSENFVETPYLGPYRQRSFVQQQPNASRDRRQLARLRSAYGAVVDGTPYREGANVATTEFDGGRPRTSQSRRARSEHSPPRFGQ